MKLIRCGEFGKEQPAILTVEGKRFSTAHLCEDYNEAFFSNDGLQKISSWAESGFQHAEEIDHSVRLGAPIARPSKIVCAGLNYAVHAAEMGLELPQEPTLFQKASTCLCGPNDPITLPPSAQKLDYEIELGLVISKQAKNVPIESARDYVAGYLIFCDVSERSFQMERGGQWNKGKSYDSFGPAGPYLLTRDELVDDFEFQLRCEVNGQMRQQSSSADMIFGIDYLVSHISQFMTLLPGDLVSTGTPEGVAIGRDASAYLKVGDTVSCKIEKLGELRNIVVSKN